MTSKKPFEEPVITSYERNELVVEALYTLDNQSGQ
jgi:hypothetical protein